MVTSWVNIRIKAGGKKLLRRNNLKKDAKKPPSATFVEKKREMRKNVNKMK